VLAAAAVAGQLDDRQAGGLGAAGREDLALVPSEAPERRADAVLGRVDADERVEVRAERFVLVAEQADTGPVAERPPPLVGPLVDVLLLAGRREVRVR